MFENLFQMMQQTLFEAVVLPAVRMLHLSAYSSEAFAGTEFFLLGIIEIILLCAILIPLEHYFPHDKKLFSAQSSDKTDLIYTLIHRLGAFSLLMFMLIDPVMDFVEGELRLGGIPRFSLDSAFPLLGEWVFLQWLVYVLILDFVDYWIHRGQHGWSRWWALHGLHHSQTHMTFWSDNRNHVLDDVIRDALLAMSAWFIGVEPAQFVAWVMLSRMQQNWQHANVALKMPLWLEYAMVSPQFHRVHHAVRLGHLPASEIKSSVFLPKTKVSSAYGCNFGVLFPWWDMLFGTANFTQARVETGVLGQKSIAHPQGENYGDGLWQQQVLGFKRMFRKSPPTT